MNASVASSSPLKAGSFVTSISSPTPRKSTPSIPFAAAVSMIVRRSQVGQARVENVSFMRGHATDALRRHQSAAYHRRDAAAHPQLARAGYARVARALLSPDGAAHGGASR